MCISLFFALCTPSLLPSPSHDRSASKPPQKLPPNRAKTPHLQLRNAHWAPSLVSVLLCAALPVKREKPAAPKILITQPALSCSNSKPASQNAGSDAALAPPCHPCPGVCRTMVGWFERRGDQNAPPTRPGPLFPRHPLRSSAARHSACQGADCVAAHNCPGTRTRRLCAGQLRGPSLSAPTLTWPGAPSCVPWP